MSDKLNINNEMRQFDEKNRKFYDELNDEEKKKFSNYLMLRWGSAIQSTKYNLPIDELQKYYVCSMNQTVNKHFFSLSKHPKLQWLLMTCVSPGMGAHKHEWIAFKGKQAKNKRASIIANLYPSMKIEEAELIEQLTSNEEMIALLEDHGWQDAEIKRTLKDLK